MRRCPRLLVWLSLLGTAGCAADAVAGPQVVPAPGAHVRVPLSGAERGRREIHVAAPRNEPLYIVDGVEVTALDDIDVANIVFIQVLNGDRAEAAYGLRGTNGVVVIATRRGGAAAGRGETDR